MIPEVLWEEIVALLEMGCLALLIGCAFAKWLIQHKSEAIAIDIERDRKALRRARDDVRVANSRLMTVRQELAKTRKQVAIRTQDLEILVRQIEQAEKDREEEEAQYAKLKEAAARSSRPMSVA